MIAQVICPAQLDRHGPIADLQFNWSGVHAFGLVLLLLSPHSGDPR